MKYFIITCLMLFQGVLSAQKIITLSIHQPPELGFSLNKTDTTIVRGSSLELGSGTEIFGGSGKYQYHWTPTSGLSDSTLLHPVATPADTTLYVLTVTDSNGCSFSLPYKVNVRKKMVGTLPVPASPSLQAVLFPNPNKGTFRVKLTGESFPKIDMILYSGTGEQLMKQTIRGFTGEHTESFRLQLAGGSYSLHILAGNEEISRRFIIH